ncbi:MAG: metalloregulator ArsR/SmtB family transcription factor [Chitinophagaceae bacterium]
MELARVEKISKSLADITRLTILNYMGSQKGFTQCSEIMNLTNLAQPSVSHHIKTLLEADLIIVEKDGRSHSYSLNSALLRLFIEQINRIAQ